MTLDNFRGVKSLKKKIVKLAICKDLTYFGGILIMISILGFILSFSLLFVTLLFDGGIFRQYSMPIFNLSGVIWIAGCSIVAVFGIVLDTEPSFDA
jgi:hypothetical protein